MTTLIKVLISLVFAITLQQVEGQIWKKLAKHAGDKVNSEAEKRAERRIDKGIDKVYDKAENEIDGNNKKRGNNDGSSGMEDKKESLQNATEQETKDGIEEKSPSHNIVWNKFDFIPGDVVIFEDGPDANEENGEFPSRWDLDEGSVEIGEFDGETVIMFLNGGGVIVPYLKNAGKDYLPEIFTIEFDVWFEKRSTTANRYFISMYDKKNQRSQNMFQRVTVYPNGIEFGDTDKRYPGTENLGWSNEPVGKWRHISMAYTKGKFKAYMDDTRLINVPHLEGNPTGLTIEGMTDKMYLKNVRVAKGGVKYYDRVLTDGKIIVNGIKFDVNKATLRPESMGPVNKIYKMMVKYPELKFSIEGHTDSDGGDDFNMELSKERAKTVMNKLIDMGIEPSRLKYTGWGESMPIADNITPEGKANNRRVEFIKF